MKCLVCGKEISKVLNEEYIYTTDTFKECFEKMKVIFCPECELFQVDIENNTENDNKLFNYYKKTYRENLIAPDITDKNSLFYVRGEVIAKLLKKYIKKEQLSVFEKGCGWGFNLMHIKKIFPKSKLYTDEMDVHTKEYLEKNGGGYAKAMKTKNMMLLLFHMC